jgi:hypothetical protein
MKKYIWIGSAITIIILAFLIFLNVSHRCNLSNGDESDVTYEMNLCMNMDGSFDIKVTTNITNTSEDSWSEIPFQFIPNIFTEKHYPKKKAGDVDRLKVKVNGEKVKYTFLGDDWLRVPLPGGLAPGESSQIQFTYTLSLPKSAYRLTEVKDNYYLAQWYPMLSTFKDGQWERNNYNEIGESYHSPYSSFVVHYKLKDGYYFASSAEDRKENRGTVSADQIKEMYIAVLNEDTIMKTKELEEGRQLRVFGSNEKYVDAALEIGSDAFSFYDKNIGKYPMKELDVVLTDKKNAGNMEYPGIVTVYANPSNQDLPKEEMKNFLSYVVTHEIAHQWFYHLVSNQSHDEAWLDEGLTEFLTYLYQYAQTRRESEFFVSSQYEEEFHIQKPSNLPLNYYTRGEYQYFVYEKPKAKLWELFDQHGGFETAIAFLQAYVSVFSYQEVTTEDFVHFAMDYFDMENDLFFRDWLKLRGFYDVKKDYFAYEAICQLKEMGILSGDKDDAFHPDKEISKYQAAELLYPSIPLNLEQDLVEITDVKKEDALYEVIQGLVTDGYFQDKDGKFHPNAALTKEELANLLLVFMEKGILIPNEEYDTWLEEYITFGENGLPTKKSFEKDELVTRGEMAFVVYKIWESTLNDFAKEVTIEIGN